VGTVGVSVDRLTAAATFDPAGWHNDTGWIVPEWANPWDQDIAIRCILAGEGVATWGRSAVLFIVTHTVFPILFPWLLPMMMPTVMPTMLQRVGDRVPVPDYMREQMPDLMPKVMDNLMPHMLPDVVPLVTQPMIDYLRSN
jgi:hypothetical protein